MPVKTALGPAEDPWHDIFRYGDKMSHPAYWSKTVNSGTYHVTYIDESQRFADKVKEVLEGRKKTEPIALPAEKKSTTEVRECPGDVVNSLQITGGTLAEMYTALGEYLKDHDEYQFAETHTYFDTDFDKVFLIARISY